MARLVVGVDLEMVVAFLDRPFGAFALADASAARTSSSPIPYLNSAPGFSSTRTAGRAEPFTSTSPTPDNCEIFCSSTVAAES